MKKECHVKSKGCSSFVFVLSWVVFEEPGFCGEPYVLEKGLYGSSEDWGALQHRVGSTMPIMLVRVVTQGGNIVWLLDRWSGDCDILHLINAAASVFA